MREMRHYDVSRSKHPTTFNSLVCGRCDLSYTKMSLMCVAFNSLVCGRCDILVNLVSVMLALSIPSYAGDATQCQLTEVMRTDFQFPRMREMRRFTSKATLAHVNLSIPSYAGDATNPPKRKISI